VSLTAKQCDRLFRRGFQRSIATQDDPSRLRAAFTDLGLDRVLAGVRALYMKGGWDECFLALAYGELGELSRLMPEAAPKHISEKAMRGWERYYSLKAQPSPFADSVLVESWTEYDEVASLMGLNFDHVDVLTRYFDSDRETFTAELLGWLDERGVNAATVLAEARREVREAERPKLDEAKREDDGSPTTHLLAELPVR
jgi:hypothetical protein